MEITARQLERLLTCTILLEEACEKNSIALRTVKLIREKLDEIEQAADAEEQYTRELQDIELPEPSRNSSSMIREYGQELMSGGAGLKELIVLTMEHFGMTQTQFANLIGVNQGSLSHYIRFGTHRDGVIKSVTEFFGFDGKAGE